MSQTIEWNHRSGVVILGAGGAGLAAAVTAAEKGLSVTVLEVMEDVYQSNTAICGGVVMGACTPVQKEAGLRDSPEEFEKYLAAAGEGFEDQEMRGTWSRTSGETLRWLMELGVSFPGEHLYLSGDERKYAAITPPVARGHITAERSGRSISRALYKKAIELNVRFFFSTKGISLITGDTGMVQGIKAEKGDSTLYFKGNRGVILASGGFSRNKELIKNFMPKMLNGGSFGSPHQMGEGIIMGQALGGQVVNMWIPQAAVFGIPTTGDMTPCMVITIWGSPCVMVNREGRRFAREDLFYEFLYEKIAEQKESRVWTIWDQAVTDLGGGRIAVPPFSSDLSGEIEKGWIIKAATLEELAGKTGLDKETLTTTLDTYNRDVERGTDSLWGKEVGLGPVKKAPFYAAPTIPATCDTAGGLKINSKAQVLNVFGQPIPGLYAAGTTTGGWRGRIYPGSGAAVSIALTYGRIAGESIVEQSEGIY